MNRGKNGKKTTNNRETICCNGICKGAKNRWNKKKWILRGK